MTKKIIEAMIKNLNLCPKLVLSQPCIIYMCALALFCECESHVIYVWYILYVHVAVYYIIELYIRTYIRRLQ